MLCIIVGRCIEVEVYHYDLWYRYNLTAVANPTSQMSVIGNLVGSTAAAQMGWNETAMILFSLGMVHYLVLFVTLYQRLSGSDKLPAMLRPVFFLFFAAPGVASMAWSSICGKFDTTAKMLFFLSVFLFMSLVRLCGLLFSKWGSFSDFLCNFAFLLFVLACIWLDLLIWNEDEKK